MQSRHWRASLSQRVFEYLDRRIGSGPRRLAGQLVALRAVKALLMGDADSPVMVKGPVYFENLEFQFTAPRRVYAHAARSGIESILCRVLMAHCRPGDSCIDVGANAGFVTLVLAKTVGASGCVLGFEPSPLWRDVLQHNLEDNRLECVVVDGRVAGAHTGRSVMFGRMQVATVTVDDACKAYGLSKIRAMKIDVDGGDYEVLVGAAGVLKASRPLVIVEMSERQQAIFELLQASGYGHIFDMEGHPVVPGAWPPNVVACAEPVCFPQRGSLSTRA